MGLVVSSLPKESYGWLQSPKLGMGLCTSIIGPALSLVSHEDRVGLSDRWTYMFPEGQGMTMGFNYHCLDSMAIIVSLILNLYSSSYKATSLTTQLCNCFLLFFASPKNKLLFLSPLNLFSNSATAYAPIFIFSFRLILCLRK